MVYVDDMEKSYQGMKMSHMIADSHSELVEMAEKIGLDKRHIQNEGTWKEHFYVCKKFKYNAIKEGAVEIGKRELKKMLNERDYEIYDR
jgi:aldehyde:ferredoxin oxidoreductase